MASPRICTGFCGVLIGSSDASHSNMPAFCCSTLRRRVGKRGEGVIGLQSYTRKKNTFNIIMVILYVKPREKEGKEVNPRRAGGLDFPWSAGGGRFYAPPPV